MDTDTAMLTLNKAAGDALTMFVSGPAEEGGHVSEEAVADALRALEAEGIFEGEGLDLDKPGDYAQARRMAVGHFLILWWVARGDKWLTKPEKREEMMSWIEEMSGTPRKDWSRLSED